MSKNRILGLIAALSVFGCAPSGDGPAGIPEILRAVPSDAIAVCTYDRLSDALADSAVLSAPMLSLQAGRRLEGRAAAVSFVYNGRLSPILSVDAGSAQSADELLLKADSLGLCSARIDSCLASGRGGVLLFSPSPNALESTMRHMTDAGESVLSANLFADAVLSASGRDCIILRNEKADRYLPTADFTKYYKKGQVTGFFSKFAPWTTLVRDSEAGRFKVEPVPCPDSRYFSNLAGKLPGTDGRLGEAVPDSSDFVIALSVGGNFRSIYEEWLDACVKLGGYEKKITELRKTFRKSPKDWEKENGVSVVAAAAWDSHRVVLVRTAANGPEELSGNPLPGFISALYGPAFAFDDSFRAADGRWTAFGSEEDVLAWKEAPKAGRDRPVPSGKGCRFAVSTPSGSIWSDEDGIHLKIND